MADNTDKSIYDYIPKEVLGCISKSKSTRIYIAVLISLKGFEIPDNVLTGIANGGPTALDSLCRQLYNSHTPRRLLPTEVTNKIIEEGSTFLFLYNIITILDNYLFNPEVHPEHNLFLYKAFEGPIGDHGMAAYEFVRLFRSYYEWALSTNKEKYLHFDIFEMALLKFATQGKRFRNDLYTLRTLTAGFKLLFKETAYTPKAKEVFAKLKDKYPEEMKAILAIEQITL